MEDGTWCLSAHHSGRTQGQTRAGLHCWKKEIILMFSEESRSMESNRYRVTLLELGGESGVPMKHHFIEEAPLTGAETEV